VVLTARNLNKKIRIVSKCIEDESERKFENAGVDKTVSPTRIGGLRMASEMVRPAAASFLDIMLRDKKGVRFDEVEITETSKLNGKTVSETGILEQTGAIIVSIRRKSGEFEYNPRGATNVVAGDSLIVLGDIEEIVKLREIAQ